LLSGFRAISHRPEWMPAGYQAPRHRHLEAYATIVLDGAYDQFAYAGHLRVAAGEVLVQPTLDCHADSMLSPGVRLLRLPWRREAGFGGVFRPAGLDRVVRAAETDVVAAARLLAEAVDAAAPLDTVVEDWADVLAGAIRADPDLSIGRWAVAAGVGGRSLSRAFARAYGVRPARFRAEFRAREAWLSVTGARRPLAEIAAELGFADQAHMTRAIGAMTGDTPSNWRRRMAA
jgi:AraC-like DNA-binding protein